MCPSTIDVVESVNEGNAYADYDNVITPSTTSGVYYKEQGRYDLVPINLTNPEVIDFQIGSPSMYQSAQCRGQFVYSRFRNIGDTFDMYANTEDGGKPMFKTDASFSDGEITYAKRSDGENDYTSDDIATYMKVTGSTNISSINDAGYKIINRLPKTWQKGDTASTKTLSNGKTLVRIANLNDTTTSSIARLNQRIDQLTTSATNSSSYTIIPKIQCAYGFTDLGNIYSADLAQFDQDDNGTSFVTTHKIGYEDRDIYAVGKDTCNSFLFLSPVNHSDIQVDGDTFDSGKRLKGGETLRVPIIYQFRMTDYRGNIFGDSTITGTSSEVQNVKYANIIGIDIWSDRNALKPKQYDIVIYSTYGSTVDTNTNRTKTSSKQTLINVGGEIVNKLERLNRDSKTVKKRKTTGGGSAGHILREIELR
jgi:hypothetical protein